MKRTLLLLTMTAIASGKIHAQNLLLNGDFNTPGSIAAPADWNLWSYGSGYANHEILTSSVLIDQNDGSVHPNNTGNYDGTYQMTLGATDTSSGAGVNQTVAATAGLTYSLSVDAGAQGWWLPTGQIRLFFLDGDNNILAETQIDTTDSLHNSSNGGQGDLYDIGVAYQNWGFSSVAPTGTTQAEVEFAGYGGGSVWFDNAVLTVVQPVPEPGSVVIGAVGLALLLVVRLRRGTWAA